MKLTRAQALTSAIGSAGGVLIVNQMFSDERLKLGAMALLLVSGIVTTWLAHRSDSTK